MQTKRPFLKIHGIPVYEEGDSFLIDLESRFTGSLQECVSIICERFARKNHASDLLLQGYDSCSIKMPRFLLVHGISINQKLNDEGQVVGYFVAEFQEDLSNLQEAVNTACGLYCIDQGVVDGNGDPSTDKGYVRSAK
jgi:hypothetical protein